MPARSSLILAAVWKPGLHAGHYARDVGPDYDDYRIGLAKSFGGLRIGAALTDTGIDNPIVYAWL